jgi:hypothetical protein
MTKEELTELLTEIFKEELTVSVEAYNESYRGPVIKVTTYFGGVKVSETTADVPEPKPYRDY